jgi:hypothetical protein
LVARRSRLAVIGVLERDDAHTLLAEAGRLAASGGVSEHGAEPAAREGHMVLSPCHLLLSRR